MWYSINCVLPYPRTHKYLTQEAGHHPDTYKAQEAKSLSQSHSADPRVPSTSGWHRLREQERDLNMGCSEGGAWEMWTGSLVRYWSLSQEMGSSISLAIVVTNILPVLSTHLIP